MFRPTVTPEQAMDQAGMTAHAYMMSAIHDINKQFGDGYAQEHPELVAAYMAAASHDYHSTCVVDGLYEISEAVRESAYRVSDQDD